MPSKETEAKKPSAASKKVAVVKKAPDVSAYVAMLQTQINTEIQAVKSGALDEEVLRAKLVTEMNPTSLNTSLTLWLHALSGGLIDNLSVIVLAGPAGPKIDFFPEWNQKTDVLAPILELPIPGPVAPAAGETPVLAGGGDSQAEVVAQQA